MQDSHLAQQDAFAVTGEVTHSYQCTTNSFQSLYMPASSPSKAGVIVVSLMNLELLMVGGLRKHYSTSQIQIYTDWCFLPLDYFSTSTEVKYNFFQLQSEGIMFWPYHKHGKLT